MTKRKPLQWIDLGDGYEAPDCYDCQDWLTRPGRAEAIASVGIEHPGVGHRAVEQYHANRHREQS
jgi:hypothetical protein